jgi:hypothetical protein
VTPFEVTIPVMIAPEEFGEVTWTAASHQATVTESPEQSTPTEAASGE